MRSEARLRGLKAQSCTALAIAIRFDSARAGGWRLRIYSGSHKGWTCWTRLNTPGNCALHAVTEINFGLHSAGRGRLARHDRPGRWL